MQRDVAGAKHGQMRARESGLDGCLCLCLDEILARIPVRRNSKPKPSWYFYWKWRLWTPLFNFYYIGVCELCNYFLINLSVFIHRVSDQTVHAAADKEDGKNNYCSSPFFLFRPPRGEGIVWSKGVPPSHPLKIWGNPQRRNLQQSSLKGSQSVSRALFVLFYLFCS